MFCKNCGKEIENNSRFCGYCGSSNNVQKENKKSNSKKIIMILFFVLILILLISTILLISNRKDKFNFNEENFSVQIMEYNLKNTEEDGDLFTIEFDNNNNHIIDAAKEYYFIDNEIIKSLERQRDGKIIWIYEKDKTSNTISYINGFEHKKFVTNIKQLLVDIINEIKISNYKKEDNIYKVKIENNLNSNICNMVKNNWNSPYLEFDYNDNSSYSDCDDCYEIFEVKNIEFKVKDSNIEELKIIFTNVVYDSKGKIHENWSYNKYSETALVFKFYNHGNTSVKLSDDIKQSLVSTQAGDFVGKYVHKKICSDGNSYDEVIELTDNFDIIFGNGWESHYEMFDCDTNTYFSTSVNYEIEDEIITIYEVFKDDVVKFKYENTKLSKIDENNNVISVFEKE